MTRFTNNVLLLTIFLCVFYTCLSAKEYTIARSRSHFQQKTFSQSNNFIETSLEQENITVEFSRDNFAEKLGNLTWIFSDGISAGLDVGTNRDIDDLEKPIFVWDCGSPEITLKSFSISPCWGDPCTLHRGQQITLTARFTAKVRAKRLSCDIMAKWGLIKKHIGCPQSDACYAPGMHCPLEVGKEYTFVAKESITSNVPKILTYYIQGSLRDENGKLFLCIATHAKIR